MDEEGGGPACCVPACNELRRPVDLSALEKYGYRNVEIVEFTEVTLGSHLGLRNDAPAESCFSYSEGYDGDESFWLWPIITPLLFQNETSDARDHCANERS
jgi:hypothetical protein